MEHLADDHQRVCTFHSLLQLDLLIVENGVAYVPKYALDFEFAASPGRSENLASNTLLIFSLLLICPSFSALFL